MHGHVRLHWGGKPGCGRHERTTDILERFTDAAAIFSYMRSIILFSAVYVCMAIAVETATFHSSLVTPDHSGDPGLSMHVQYSPPPVTLTMKNVTLQFCLQQAYSLTAHQVFGPSWIRSARYDVTATLPANGALEQVWPALQSLLDERFKLSLQHETKVLPIYALTAAKGGLKLRPAKERGQELAKEDRRENASSTVHLDSATMKQFCEVLSRRLDRLVIGDTGISGTFEVELSFEGSQGRSSVAIFSAMQKQLGLKLTPGNRPVEILTVKNAVRTPRK